MSFKQIPNGDWYNFTTHGNTIYIVKQQGAHGNVDMGHTTPKELIGKRVRIKLEIVNDKETIKPVAR